MTSNVSGPIIIEDTKKKSLAEEDQFLPAMIIGALLVIPVIIIIVVVVVIRVYRKGMSLQEGNVLICVNFTSFCFILPTLSCAFVFLQIQISVLFSAFE